jgi:hypothetical protein
MRFGRRDFLRKVGWGSVALSAWSRAIDILARPVWAQDKTRTFQVVAFSSAGKTPEGVEHYLGLNGEGRFDPQSGAINAGGSWAHFDNAATVTPKTLINAGRWKATKIRSYEKVLGTYGRINASVLEMQVDLLPDLGTVRRIEGATLRVICNIGAAGITTGEPEGYVLTVPGGQTFRPLSPVLGLTHISVPGGGGERPA